MTTPWSSGTNWTVSRGSLDSAVTFESFDFPIESESTGRKPPLLLLTPSSSDFEPCEIKLNFSQKHEIRQIYVRSTARVYEIYYAPALQSDNEYLCTVRCSAASVDESLFPATDVKETISENSEGPNEILPKSRVPVENKIGTNEDDWVEIKLPVGQVDEGNAYLPNQEYYEATAEINDSDPCMSLTLRLLSLQTKGCVYIDEIYIFADSVDSESPKVNTENSASSLMSMLVPTLIGLTKSKSAQLQHTSNPVAKPSQPESKPELTRSQMPVLTQVKDGECDSGMRKDIPFSSNRAEILLEQLVSRVTRIEDCFLRFEENMLKPLNKIEARLECVEKQVELLNKKSTFESNPENVSQIYDESESELESEKTESFSSGTHKPPDEVDNTSVSESSCCDEKLEEKDILESPKKEKPKKPVSIDDALAAALSGFSSFNEANDSLTPVTPESRENESLENNQDSVITNVESNNDTGIYKEITDDIFRLEVTEEEDTGPTESFIHENAEIVDQDCIKEVKMLTFEKIDIPKYLLNESESCTVDFESPILEVKFDSLENGTSGSHLEALLSSCTDDTVVKDDVLMNSQTNENVEIGNNLLVDFDGDDQVLQQDISDVQQETCFASLI